MKPLLLFAYLAGLLGLSTSVAWAQTGTITGTIFEDLNYGGGAGRSRLTANTAQAGSAVAVGSAATVELYTSAGAYVRTTTTSTATATLGQYSFGSLAAGSYLVRVVNSTVRSTRPGAVAGLLPVQTFRTQSGNGTADPDRVGGEAPELTDAGAYTPGTSATTFTFTSLATSGDNAIFLDNLTLNNSAALPNNSFETPSQGTGNGAYTYRPTGATWAFSGNAGITYASNTNNSAWGAPAAPDGTQVAFVQSLDAAPGSLQQTITLVPGTTYTLTLRAAQRNNGGKAQVVQGTTTINGTTTALTFTSTLGTVSNGNIAPTLTQGFATYTATFTVPAPSNVLGTFTAQSLAPVTLATAASAVTGVDFGFNFSTIVNPNESGQGSLRQFILNSNALTNAGLAQVGQLAGREASIFMIPDGNAHAGQRTGLTSGLTGAVGAARAVIAISSAALPAITDGRTRIDGTVQTTYIGDTNAGQLGTGGTAGVKAVALAKINRPEIELSVDNSLAYGLDLEGDSLGVRGIALHGGVLRAGLTASATNLQIISNLLGINALTVADPAGTTYNPNYGIQIVGTSYGVVRNNLVGYASNSGLNYSGGANTTGLTITRNEFVQNGYRNAGGDGISIGDNATAGPVNILFNLITTSNSDGLQFEIGQVAAGGINVVRNNTFFDNGNGSSSTVRTQREGAAILYLQRFGNRTGTNADSISYNIVNQSQASGIVVGYGQRNVIITRNSTFGNGTSRNSATGGNLSIDLISNPAYYVNSPSTIGVTDYGNGDGVTPNTGSLNTAFGNGGMNYPIFTLTRYNTSTSITVAGYVGSAAGQTAFRGATVDIYFANNLDGNNSGGIVSGDNANVAHGEGQTYLTTLTADANGNFSATIPAPAGVVFSTSGQVLTATAYLSGSGTSEFGPNSPLEAVVVSGYVFEDANYGGGAGRSRATLGSGAVGRPGAAVEIYDATNALVGSAITDNNGAYSFTVPAGNYKVRTVVPSVTSARPNGLTASPALVAVQTYVRGDVNRVGGERPSALADDAAAPTVGVTLSFIGRNPSGLDNTAFLDQVEVVDASGNVVATSPVGNAGFETPALGNSFAYSPSGASWTFGSYTGVSGNGSGFNSNTTNGTQVGFVQGDGATLQQTIQLPAGTYSVRFLTAQRVLAGRVNNQTISVQLNGAEIGRITPSTGDFVSFRTNEFAVAGSAQSSTPGLSQTSVVVNTASVTDVDFGYNFDTVVNTNDTGQGSLRQFIANSNALGGETALAPVHTGPTGTTTALATGLETSIFMISNGTAVAGLRAGLPSGFATTTGTSTAATFTPASALPAITGPNTSLDGNTQTRTTGATNAVVTTAAAESTGPEVILNLNGFTGLAFSGANEQVTGLGITNSAAASSGILVNSTATGLTISNNTIYGNGANVSLLGSASGNTIVGNVIRSSTRTGAGGIVAQGGTNTNTFSQNIFDANTGLAIDLTNGTTTNGDGVTLNDLNDADTGANGLANFPILTSPGVSSTTLTVRGYARPGALVEVYIAAIDPTNFGEGQSYLGSFVQGTAVGTVGNVVTGAAATYGPATINGLGQGTDNTNTFLASLPMSSFTAAQRAALLSGTAYLTSTATVSGSTSEFSGDVLLPVADVTVSITGPTTLSAGKPTGTYTATFTNEGGGTATNVARVITLPTGASLTTAQQTAILAAYPNATFSPTGTTAVTTIDFGAVPSLALNATSSVSFAFTAPNALATNYTLTATTTADSQGVNTAPDQTTLTLSTVTSADVMAAISASATATTGTFNVTFSNILAQTAAGVVRTVQLPTGLTGVTVTGTDAGSYSATTGLVTYTTSPTSIAAGSSLTSAISYPLTSGAVAITAVASISTTTDEAGLTANNTASATMTTVLDLATTLSGPATTIAGSPTMLYVTTANGGPNAAPATVQSVQLVAGLTNVFLTNGGVYNPATSIQTLVANGVSYSVPAGGVIFPLTGLATGQNITNSVSFNAPGAAFAPVATVAAAGTTAVVETSTTNNTAYLNAATVSTNMTVTGATANAANEATTIMAMVGATTTPATVVNSGSTVTYTVTATNNGPSATTGVVQKVQLLPGLTTTTLSVGTNPTITTLGNGNLQYVTAGGTSTYSPTTGVLTYYTLTNQASGNTTTYDKIAVTTPAALGNGAQMLATASVTTNLSDPVPADNVASVTVKVRTLADLTTSVSGPAAPVGGLPATYVVQFANNGPGDAVTVTGTAQLPAGLTSVVVTDVSGTVVSGAYNSTTGLVTFPTQASLAAGTSQAYTIVLTAPYQSFPVSSTVASTSTESSLTNNSASLSTSTSINADVAVSISGPVTAVVGNPVTYIVTTTNNGPTVANGITAMVQLPAGLTNVTSGPGGGTSYNSTSGVLTFATTGTLGVGGSALNYVTFTMPNPASGQISGLASVSTTSLDQLTGNNTAGLTTSIAPTTTDVADLATSITLTTPSGSPTTVPAGTLLTYNAVYRNIGPNAATNVMPTANLLTGLAAASLQVGGVTGTLANGVITFSTGPAAGATYNVTTGLLTFPTIASQALNASMSYMITFPAMVGSGQLIVYSEVASSTTDNGPGANRGNSVVNISTAYDVVTTLAGPLTSLPGTLNTYTVTTLNNGPSTASAATTQLVNLPTGLTTSTLLVAGQTGTVSGTNITFSNSGATYSTTTGVLTLRSVANLPAGPANEVVTSFALVMPASGSLALAATVASANETYMNNNQATFTTDPANLAPAAQNVWNTLQTARGNTANLAAATGLAISPLVATDADGISTYTVVTLPSTTQGALYYNGTAVKAGDPVAASGLTFAPTPGFVGNATFTYSATDNANATNNAVTNAVSNVALYTIPVAQDQSSTYEVYNKNKGGTPANNYVTGDVLAQLTDANTATYNSAGLIYNATSGVLQGGAANGLPLTGTNATLVAGTLPPGVTLDAATGRIYVSNAASLVNNPTVRTYTVSVRTTDINGGTNVVPVTITIGAYPLPVVLTAFSAQAVANRDALLNWATASEQHNDHFDIERSFDGNTFAKIGQLAGHGSTAAASTYSLTDAGVAAQATGPVYYRLKQVDTDGTSTFSPVRTVSFTPALTVSLRLFPNPVVDVTYLDLSQLPAATSVQAQLLDATGRTVLSWSLAGGLHQPLELTSLASGTYLLVVSGTQPDGSALHQTIRVTKE